ncbi:18738_t:CDS:2 [Funneliformis geosporum]|uniref:18738_t:CDS:1 n=1 Tax=Funneliformis geosporum TaxID=1117311 RepID=A0A9W4SPH0_9GLOM|nr:18738_t:CDS:2 [Funneliformis geosporum]
MQMLAIHLQNNAFDKSSWVPLLSEFGKDFTFTICNAEGQEKLGFHLMIKHYNLKNTSIASILRLNEPTIMKFYKEHLKRKSEELEKICDNEESSIICGISLLVNKKKHYFRIYTALMTMYEEKKVALYNTNQEQLEAIKAYLGSKDTLESIKTREEKTFCYINCALVFEGITIVINPLKALIEDQKRELICLGIPFALIYANSIQGKTTCTYQDVQDIRTSLKISVENFTIIRGTSFKRKVIAIEVFKRKDNHEIFSNKLMNLIKKHENGRAIVYYATQSGCNDLFAILQPLISYKNLAVYHEELGDE